MQGNLQRQKWRYNLGISAGHWPAEQSVCLDYAAASTVRQEDSKANTGSCSNGWNKTKARRVKNIRWPTYDSLSDFAYEILLFKAGITTHTAGVGILWT